MYSLSLQIHGLHVRVEASDSEIVDDLSRRMAHFFAPATVAAANPDLECVFDVVADSESVLRLSRPLGPARTLGEPAHGEMLYFEAADELYVELPGLRMLTCPRNRRAHVVLVDEPRERLLATRPIFTFSVNECLKRRGLYTVHAASVACDGRALVLAGPNGVGKSTLAIALLGVAPTFLGDDLIFIRSGDDGVHLLPFPDNVAVTPETAAKLSADIRDVLVEAPGARKLELDITRLAGVVVASEASPVAVVLLVPDADPTYRLEELDRAATFVALTSNVLATDEASAQGHLDALGSLVEASACYRLRGRGTVDAAVELLRPLLAP